MDLPAHAFSCAAVLQVMQHDLCLASRAKRIYANAHTYHINSISVNSDQQTFLSADDLRINLWNLDVTDQSFNIVDIKPPNMDDLTEVRSSAWVCLGVFLCWTAVLQAQAVGSQLGMQMHYVVCWPQLSCRLLYCALPACARGPSCALCV